MKLYFFRHGEAEPHELHEDFERQLTAEGRAETRNAAVVLAALKITPTRLYSSPRIRARQTAEIIAEKIGKPVEISERCDLHFNVHAVHDLLEGLNAHDDVMFVGHEPSLSMTLASLTGASLEMKKGGCARVDLYPGTPLRGTLIWLLTPKIFNVLADKE